MTLRVEKPGRAWEISRSLAASAAIGFRPPREMTMDGREGIQLAAIILLVLAALVAVALGITVLTLRRLAQRLESSLSETQREVSSTLVLAQGTLARVDKLTLHVDEVLRDKVAPSLDSVQSTLGHAERSARSLSDGVSGVGRVAQAVSTISGAGALAGITRGVASRGGKIGIAALVAGAVLRAFFRRDHRSSVANSSAPDPPMSANMSNRVPSDRDPNSVQRSKSDGQRKE
jgi:uncharacterized protein YoxC